MELILISDSKLKVMLSADDMEKYEIRSDEIDYDNTETRRAFWQILDEVKQRTGFDAATDKVLIQVYPSRDGGCEMFVTKLSGVSPAVTDTLARSRSVAMLSMRTCIYSFDKLEKLLRVCRSLYRSGYNTVSSAYHADNGRFYLVLQEHFRSGGGGGHISEFSFIEEYGTCHRGAMEMAYIKEHATCIDDTAAVEKLADLVC
ncbi:MAG: adaptor protein MecA [Eubacteriales bacterium]